VPIEQAVLGLSGPESSSSTSSTGTSIVTGNMRYGTNMSSVQQDLQAAISRIDGVLPEDSDSQVITGSLDDFSVLQLSVTDDSASGQLVERFQITAVPALEQIDGVRAVEIAGSPVPQVQSRSLSTWTSLPTRARRPQTSPARCGPWERSSPPDRSATTTATSASRWANG
jgi:multidrug efflux pump subunit AcrB